MMELIVNRKELNELMKDYKFIFIKGHCGDKTEDYVGNYPTYAGMAVVRLKEGE